MTGLRVWLWRSSAKFAWPGLVVAAAVVAYARTGWQYEWNWALSNASTPTILLSPLIAGLVAYDRGRRATPTLEALAGTATRMGLYMIAVAGWAWAVLAWLVVAGSATFVAARHGASGTPDPWIFFQVPGALFAASFFGLAWGSRFRSVAAAPTAAVVVYVLVILTNVMGLPGIFVAGRSTGSLIGMEQVPKVAANAIAMSVAFGMLAVAWHRRQVASPWRGASLAPTALMAVLVVAIGVYGIASGDGDTYRARQQRPICVGLTVEVCGPPDGRALLTLSADGLDRATRHLAASGIQWNTRYELRRGDDVFSLPESAGLLRVGPEDINDGHATSQSLAATLAMPRLCQGYFGPQPPEGLLSDQQLVMSWTAKALAEGQPATAAPTDVVSAYASIAGCKPARTPDS